MNGLAMESWRGSSLSGWEDGDKDDASPFRTQSGRVCNRRPRLQRRTSNRRKIRFVVFEFEIVRIAAVSRRLLVKARVMRRLPYKRFCHCQSLWYSKVVCLSLFIYRSNRHSLVINARLVAMSETTHAFASGFFQNAVDSIKT